MTSTKEAERQAAVEHLREMLHDIPVAMLTTQSSEGSLHARPMVNVNEKFDGDLWFFTYYDDPKTQEIEANSQVNVSFASPSQNRFISVTGKAELVRDAKRCELLWTSDCEPWFPNGPQDPAIALVKVDVDSAEYWDQQRSAMVAMAGLFKRLVTGERPAHLRSEQVQWSGEASTHSANDAE